MEYSSKVFIATSIDGYIADKNGNIDWLYSVSNQDNIDMGYATFINSVDALLMGKNTFETVHGFDMDWPYKIPVYVLSNSLKQVPEELKDRVFIVKGELQEILNKIHSDGHRNLYIDGGTVISAFVKEDLIDELTITIIPVLLGDGIPLFSKSDTMLQFECVETKHYLGKVSQHKFVRIKQK